VTGRRRGVAELLTPEQALRAVLEQVRPLATEQVALDVAAGRVLAADALAAVDLPPFDSSAMDGFAVRVEDTPGTLSVVDRAAAGRPAERTLQAGAAIGIATGAAVPVGATGVVPIEDVDEDGDTVAVRDAVRAGANVRPSGGDVTAGGVVVQRGARLGASQIGALAAAGVTTVTCSVRPRVTVLATGSELRQPGETLRPGEIYESNGRMLGVALAAAGATVTRLSPVEDTPAAHREAFAAALEDDVVVSTGGVSVGPHDLVRTVGRELGVGQRFWGVAMRPGKPLWFGGRDETLVFGLPGNPVSSLVGATLFVVPALLALQGAAAPEPFWQTGVLATPLARNVARDDFVRARLASEGGTVTVSPVTGQESHMIVRTAAADALVHVPRGEGELAAGAAVPYLSLS
jgi:molybdopterin molybdotransferase